MSRRVPLAVLAAALALVLAVAAHAANVTVNATVAGGTTLSAASLNTPAFNLTLNGDDQTTSYQAQLQVVDARGLATGGGWNLTLGSTRFTSTSGKTLPDERVDNLKHRHGLPHRIHVRIADELRRQHESRRADHPHQHEDPERRHRDRARPR